MSYDLWINEQGILKGIAIYFDEDDEDIDD